MSKEKKWTWRVADMLGAIDHIEKVTNGVTEKKFTENLDIRRICERNLEIIAEASKNLPDFVKEEYPAVEWRAIVNMRNLISHEYEAIDDLIVWNAIQEKLPGLK